MATTGISTERATSQTMRMAMGLMAGPERPPMPVPSPGLPVRQSTAMPSRVLISDTASEPPSAEARAMSAMSETFGDSFVMTGRRVAERTSLTRRCTTSGSRPKGRSPPSTLGHEMFSSSPSTPSQASSCPAISPNSPVHVPAMLTMRQSALPARRGSTPRR